MGLPALITATVFITLVSIFGFYKLFLDKPQSKLPPVTQNASTSSPAPSQTLKISPAPSPTKSSAIATAKPTSNLIPSPKSNVTVLENNITSSPAASSEPSSAISGTISFTGSAPSESSIVIITRVYGSGDQFKTVVSGISASNNASWSWTGAKSGTSYDLVAVLKGTSGGNNIDYATSQTYVVNAPATNQIFLLNAGSSLSAPAGSITTDCYYHNPNNTWYVTIKFSNVSAAQAYWLQVGTTSGGNDLADVKQNTKSSTSQDVNSTFNDSQIYYARYSVASVPDPTSVQYSAFSPVTSIKCP